jgi:CRISPR system Cascade subunit CasB
LPTRFAALGTASDFHEISHYARQLITQLRAVSLPLDYGTLAKQLYCLQVPSLADGVRLAWGRDFAQAPTATTDPSNPSTQKEA